jgi:thioredoxin 1
MEVTKKKLNELLHSDIPLLVEFWGSWCPPCQQQKHVLGELAERYDDKLNIAKINIDRNPGIATQYDILGVPTYIIFKKGEIVDRAVGAKSPEQLEGMLQCVM